MVKKLIAGFCSAAALCFTAAPAYAADSQPEMRDITTMELVKDMGVGINLGNTLESCGSWIDQWGGGKVEAYETAWGSPVITEDMIKGYADAGFGVLRVPVAWSNMMSADYTINPNYLARTREIVDWALDADMYVILNIHWDGGWWENFSTDKTECMKKYTRIWDQLTEEFAGYDDYLMFESLNEEGHWDDIALDDAYALLNEINQTFVDLVRDSGGNNDERHLLIAGYATDVDKTCDARFVMPDDPMNRCAVSVHYYTPATFCLLEEDVSWGKCESTWGDTSDVRVLNGYMNKLQKTFVNNDIPVIIGEYGCPTKNKEIASVRNFISYTAEAALKRNMCPVLWDVTDLHYSRETCSIKDSVLADFFAQFRKLSYSLGDVDADGNINALDASMILTAYANTATGKDSGLVQEQITAADVNSDGAVDALDASEVLSYYAYTATNGSLSFPEFIAK